MFNYYSADVQTCLQQVQQQAQKVLDIDRPLTAAIQTVQNGIWIGDSADTFLADAARLQNEIKRLHTELSEFRDALAQASQVTEAAIGQIHGVVSSLP